MMRRTPSPAELLSRELWDAHPHLPTVYDLLDSLSDINQPLPDVPYDVTPPQPNPPSPRTHFIINSQPGAPKPSAVHLACLNGHSEVLAELIQRGAQLSLHSKYGKPLRIAARLNHPNCCEHLLQAGVNPNEVDHNHATALHHISYNLLHSINALTYDRTALKATVHTLIDYGANPNLAALSGDSALSHCLRQSVSFAQQSDTIGRILVQAGALIPFSLLDDENERLVSDLPSHSITSSPLLCHLLTRKAEARALLSDLCDASPPKQPHTLTANQVCLLSNIGQHQAFFTPEHWAHHPDELHTLLAHLPLWLCQDILAHHPLLTVMTDHSTPAPLVSHGKLDQRLTCPPPHTPKR